MVGGYFGGYRAENLLEGGGSKMAERKGFGNHEPAEAKAGEKPGMDRKPEGKGKDGKHMGRKHSRHSSRK